MHCRFVGFAFYTGMTDVLAIADYCKGLYVIVFAREYEDVCVEFI